MRLGVERCSYRSYVETQRCVSTHYTIINQLVPSPYEILGERNGAFVTLAALLSLDNLIRQRISYDFRLVEQDPDDDKFVNAYVAGQADYLVTDDRHFRVVLASRFPTVRVVSTAEFMAMLAI